MSTSHFAGSSPEVREILTRCERQGYRIEKSGGNHWKVFITGDRRQWLLDNGFEFDSRASHMVSMSSTPNDPMAMKNGLKYLKWMGFDYAPPKARVEKPAPKPTPVVMAQAVKPPIIPAINISPKKRIVPLTYEQVIEALIECGPKGASVNELVTEHSRTWGIHEDVFTFEEVANSVSSKLRITGLKRGAVLRLENKEKRPYSEKKTIVYVAARFGAPVEGGAQSVEQPEPTIVVESLSDLQAELMDETVKKYQALGEAPACPDYACEVKDIIDMLMELPLSIVEDDECRAQIRRIAPLVSYVSE